MKKWAKKFLLLVFLWNIGLNGDLSFASSLCIPLIKDQVRTITHEIVRIGNKSIPITRIDTQNEKGIYEKDLFSEPTELIIGIDSTGGSKGHGYLVFYGLRIDARLFFLKDRERDPKALLAKGLVFKFNNLPKQVLEELKTYLNFSGFRSLTCISGLCKILKTVGLDIQKGRVNHMFPLQLMEHIVSEGLRTENGRVLDYEAYMINTSYEAFKSELPQPSRILPTIWSLIKYYVIKKSSPSENPSLPIGISRTN